MNDSKVRPIETTFLLTHAFETCRKKALKKNFANDKLVQEEKD